MKTDGDVKDFHWSKKYMCHGVLALGGFLPPGGEFFFSQKVPSEWTAFPILVMFLLKDTLVVTSALTFSRFMSSTQEFAKSLQFFSTRAGFTKQFPTMHTITRTHCAAPLNKSKIAAGDENLLDLGFLDAVVSSGPGRSTDQYFLVVKIGR